MHRICVERLHAGASDTSENRLVGTKGQTSCGLPIAKTIPATPRRENDPLDLKAELCVLGLSNHVFW